MVDGHIAANADLSICNTLSARQPACCPSAVFCMLCTQWCYAGCAYKRSDLPRSCCDLLDSYCRTALLQSLEESHMYSCARQV